MNTSTLIRRLKFKEAEGDTHSNPDELRAQITAEVTESISAALKAERDQERSGYDALLNDELANAPPYLSPLIPASLPLIDQVKWLRKAKECGASFAHVVPETDSRKPNNQPPITDPASLSTYQRIAAGYGKN